MKSYILTTLLLSFLTSPSLMASGTYFSGSLDCNFLKNNSEEIKFRVVKGEDYEEESTEIYFAEDGEVQAHIIYLPFQYGILMSLKAGDTEVESEGENSANTSLKVGTDTYSLSCKE